MKIGEVVYFYIENIINNKFVPKMLKGVVYNIDNQNKKFIVKKEEGGYSSFDFYDIGKKLLTEDQKNFILK
mgnify:CR=1 FL=1